MLRQLQSRTAITSRHVSLKKYPRIPSISSSSFRVNISNVAERPQVWVKEEQKQGYRDIYHPEIEHPDAPYNQQGGEASNLSTVEDLSSDRLYNSDRLYVANIPYDATPEDVVEVFEEFGVSEVKLRMDDGERFPAGDAFVTFNTIDAAAAAFNSVKTFDLYCKGRKLRIGSARPTLEAQKQLFYPTDTLFLTGFTPTAPSVKAVIRKFLPREFSQHVIFHSHKPLNSKTNAVYGFIVFDCIQVCKRAKESLDEYLQAQPELPFKINYARSHRSSKRSPLSPEHQCAEGNKGNASVFADVKSVDIEEFIANNPSLTKTIFVANVSLDATARDLRDVFQGFGIFAIWISVDREGNSRGFAHLKCTSLDEAANLLLTSKKRGFSLNENTLELDFARQEFTGRNLPSTRLHLANFNEGIQNVNAVVETILPPEFAPYILRSREREDGRHGYIDFRAFSHSKEARDIILQHGRKNPRDAIHIEYGNDLLNDVLDQL